MFVTFLWSTSWVLVKMGLQGIPSLTFAGLRYFLAFLCLLPLARRRISGTALRRLPRATWARLIALGLLYYTVTQGAQFAGLSFLPATTLNLVFSFTPILVAFLGIATLGERPTAVQWAGTVVCVAGGMAYFYPAAFPAAQWVGLIIALIGMVANALSSVLGRSANRDPALDSVAVTTISMGIGGAVLLLTGVVFQGLPPLSLSEWAIIAWLAVVNSAWAFTLWNQSLHTLTAMESSVINSAMMIQIPILAVLFLEEALSCRQALGLAVAAIGILLVQMAGRREGTHSPRGAEDCVERS